MVLNLQRYEELDSLRGLAALTVVFSHFMVVFNINYQDTYGMGLIQNWYKYSPIRLFWAGHEAVILFFILSGFVLTIPFLKNNPFSYKGYLVKRIFRIYLASATSIIVAVVLKEILDYNSKSVDSEWINTLWNRDFSVKDLINHFMLIGNYPTNINPVLWSLVHEMRISLIFPIIVYFILKFKWNHVLIFTLSLSTISCVIHRIFSDESQGSLWLTTHYSGMFIVGTLLAKYHRTLINKIVKLRLLNKISLLIIGVLFYTFNWFFSQKLDVYNILTIDWSITVGASIFIILSLSSNKLSKILKTKIISFFGKISYSLYLYHLIFLIFFIRYNSGLSISLTVLLTFIVSLIVAAISYKFIEKPSIKVGRNIAKRFRRMELEEVSSKSV